MAAAAALSPRPAAPGARPAPLAARWVCLLSAQLQPNGVRAGTSQEIPILPPTHTSAARGWGWGAGPRGAGGRWRARPLRVAADTPQGPPGASQAGLRGGGPATPQTPLGAVGVLPREGSGGSCARHVPAPLSPVVRARWWKRVKVYGGHTRRAASARCTNTSWNLFPSLCLRKPVNLQTLLACSGQEIKDKRRSRYVLAGRNVLQYLNYKKKSMLREERSLTCNN
ncbi:uncharacterized protein [Melanerpes formicivorus]|uniref:uncharacterized protein n=1 Tax=Melanerpes formicivorus TaxID=211600 RepID=UPI00358FF832